MGRYTCAYNCENSSDSDVKFFKFPLYNPRRLKKWLVNMKWKDWTPSRFSVLCSDHFEEQHIDRTGKCVKLREDAVPTIFSPPDDTQKRKASINPRSKRHKPPNVKASQTGPGQSPTTTPATGKRSVQNKEPSQTEEEPAGDKDPKKSNDKWRIIVDEGLMKIESFPHFFHGDYCVPRDIQWAPDDNTECADPENTIEVKEPWQWLGLDVRGPLPQTLNGHKYILTVTDFYSKWVEAVPMQSCLPSHVAKHIVDIIAHFGYPLRILSRLPHDIVHKHIADLLQSSKSRVRMAGRARLSLSHTVLLSLTLLSERVSYRSVSRRFHLEKGNIHRIFFSFCERVNMLEETLIRWPVGREAVDTLFPLSSPEKEQEEEQQGVPQVLGVLGHTRIPIRLPIGKHDVESTVPEVKRMKKEAHPDSWLNLQLICDRKGRFLHCRISQGSDVDRVSALRNKLKQHPELMPSGSCLVARAGYPLTAQILTPYSGSHGPREELFNKTLEEHFHILDQAVANLRARFQRLRYLDIGNYDRARAVVLTACVLHNVFLDMGHVVQGEVEKEEATTREGEGEVDEEGVRRRDAISDLLFKNLDSGSA